MAGAKIADIKEPATPQQSDNAAPRQLVDYSPRQ